MTLDIKQTVSKKDWMALVRNFLPSIVTDCYSFIEGMHIVGALLNKASDEMESGDTQIDFFRDYCVNMMIILRAKFPQEWENDWKNEAFLGIACRSVYREEEGFQYIQNAFQQLEDPPESLILPYIRAGETCDHFLSKESIKALSQKAAAKRITYEVALQMASLSHGEGNKKESQYWEEKAKDAENDGIHNAIIVPNVLKGICPIPKGYVYER